MNGGVQRDDDGADRRGEQDKQANEAGHISMIGGQAPFRLMKWRPPRVFSGSRSETLR
jgi:hypothetical protein